MTNRFGFLVVLVISLSKHKWRFYILAGALMQHFLEGSGILSVIQMRKFVFVTLLIWVNVLQGNIPLQQEKLLYVLMMKPLSHCNILLLTRKLFYITPICERSPRQTTCLLCCYKKYSRKLLLLMIWHPYVMPVWIIWVCNNVTCPLYWRWHAIVGMKF